MFHRFLLLFFVFRHVLAVSIQASPGRRSNPAGALILPHFPHGIRTDGNKILSVHVIPPPSGESLQRQSGR